MSRPEPARTLDLGLDTPTSPGAGDGPGERAVAGVGDVAAIPGGPDALADAAPACRACELWEGATQVVFGEGPPGARMVVVGEQPGDREDREGRPFVGPSGRLLDDALVAAGIDRSEVYVTNAVKHFRWEPGDHGKRIHKTPARRHVTACRPWLAEELDRVDPAVVVALGATAAQAVGGPGVRVGTDRGRVLQALDGRTLVVTTHPSAVVRLRGDERDGAFSALVADLRVAAGALDA